MDSENMKLKGFDKALEVVPELYQDMVKPSATEVGKLVALVPRTINAALAPLHQWLLTKENNLKETEQLLANKLEKVDPQKIVTPDAYVAVPALQAISYSLDSAELRDLYANLLAKSMNIDTKDQVHPSYVEIIKQMSPIDAVIFQWIHESKVKPLLNLYIQGQTSGQTNHVYNLSWITAFAFEDVSISINSLRRIGLIDIPADTHYTTDSVYDSVRKTPHFKEHESRLNKMNLGVVTEDKKVIIMNSLSESFYRICVTS